MKLDIQTDTQPYYGRISNTTQLTKTALTRFHRGEVLATAATGELSDSVADNAGLVSTHAYAVLDVRFVQLLERI